MFNNENRQFLTETSQSCVIICATVKDVAADFKLAGVDPVSTRALIVEAQEYFHKLSDKILLTPLFDYLSESIGSSKPLNMKFGQSIQRYGPLISGAIEDLVRKKNPYYVNENGPKQILAQWMYENFAIKQEKKQISLKKLERKEFFYFLFSSSQRSKIVIWILDYFFEKSRIASFVDHGAGIGIIPLCIHFANSNPFDRVVCSEIKHNFIAVGKQLWESLGYGDVIQYQESCATEFIYPAQVTVVMFAQMLYRIDSNDRQEMINKAWDAIEPGGLLIINELMDREDALVRSKLLTSDEMKAYLPKNGECWIFCGGVEQIKPNTLSDADAKIFKRSDNFIVVRKPKSTIKSVGET